MADMLTIGSLATSTFKRALDVTSHNVANVTTEGYSRQRAEIVSNTPNVVGSAFLGGGSAVSNIERISADYIQRQLYSSQTLVSRYDASLGLAKQVEGVVAGNDEGVKEFMQRFFDSLQTVASNPTSSPTRQIMLDEAGNLESHLSNLTSVLGDIQLQTNEQIDGLSKEINDRLESIHNINNQVERALAVGTQPPNDLLDQRDQAILELSQYIDIQTFPQDDGSIDVHAGGGKIPLITSNTLTKLEVGASPYPDENRTEVYAFVAGERRVVSDQITGGQLGGVLDFRSEMLDTAQNDLGLTINGLVTAMNWQQYQGWDIEGNPGTALFAPLDASVLKNVNNNELSSDGKTISVTFNPANPAGLPQPPFSDPQAFSYEQKQSYFDEAMLEIGQFESREYELRYDPALDGGNGGFNVYDRKSNELLGNFAVDSTNPSIIDGLEFKGDDGVYTNGDKFIVKPHQDMLEDFETLIRDQDKIATRGNSPIPDFSVLEEQGLTTDSAAFDSLFSSTVSGLSAFADIDTNGDLTIDAAEYANIGAIIQPTMGAFADNTNIANMASMQTKKLLLSDSNDEASSTFLGGYSVMASNVGMYVRSSDIQLSAQENVHQQIVDRRESLSGVSLDEEAANLLRYQQAFEASAQIISTAQSLFQTLLGVVRG